MKLKEAREKNWKLITFNIFNENDVYQAKVKITHHERFVFFFSTSSSSLVVGSLFSFCSCNSALKFHF